MTQLVNIGLIGVGRWGPNLLRGFHNRQHSIVARVVDLREDRLAHVSARYPDIEVSRSVEHVIDAPDIDAVVIATPASTHFELARRALQAGKHAFVEKPLTTDSSQAEQLVALAEQAGRILAIGHVFLHNPAIAYVKGLIDRGGVGNLQYVSMVRTNLGPVGIDVNVAWDLATHDVSIANYWLGAAPLSASARGGRWMSAEKEDTIFATLAYPGGRLVNLTVSWLHPVKQRAMTVVGDRCMLTVDDMSLTEPIRIHDKRITKSEPVFVDSYGSFRASIRDGEIVIPRVGGDEPVRVQCDHFIQCIRTGGIPINDGRSALAVVRTIEAINRSTRSNGCEQPLDHQP